jgi:putative peptide maturation dehydrogenase
MARVRRTRFLAFTCQDDHVLDIPALLRGSARLEVAPATYAISILRGREYPITADELAFVLAVPSDRWEETQDADRELVQRLARRGLLITDDEDDELAELARRDRELEDSEWNLYGALAYFPTKWRDVDLGFGPGNGGDVSELPAAVYDAVDQHVARHGPAPPAFHSLARPEAVHELPLVRRRGGLYDALAQRKTTRHFDPDARMTVDELATVLYYVFGCHGYAGMAGNGLMIKRTSPSGGGLHPVEAYPLLAGVEGIPTGLYHYNARDHSLELVSAVRAADIGDMAAEFVCGQRYFASAHALFLMTARFYRSFWKYRRHQKAQAALMMDAAHLSQTLYLVAAELGLGAFVTAAVNGANIEERLGLDGCTEGALAVGGCGRRAAGSSALEPRFAPYVPRETVLPAMPDQAGSGS